MRGMQGRIPITLAIVEVGIVAVGLVQSVATYVHYVTAPCGLSVLGPEFWGILLLLLALPLALGLPIYVLASAARQRRWAWVAVAGLPVTVGILMVLSGYSLASRPLIVALLGETCDDLYAYVTYFAAYAIVALTCLAYVLWPRPTA